MRAAYSYQGDATCAADGMCQEKCPVKINTGELIKSIRAEELKAAGANASRAEALSMVRTRRCVALALMLTARVVRGHRIAVLSKALSMVHTPCWAALARARAGGLRVVSGRRSTVLPGWLLRAGGLHLPVHRWVVHESRCGLPARRLGVVAAGHYTHWCITVAALQVAGSQVADGCGARAAAQRLANNYGTFVSAVPKLLNVVDFAHRVVGPKPLEYMSGAINRVSGHAIPAWNPYMPRVRPRLARTIRRRPCG